MRWLDLEYNVKVTLIVLANLLDLGIERLWGWGI